MSHTEDQFTWHDQPIRTAGDLLDAASQAQNDGLAPEFLTAYRAANPYADSNLGYVIGYMGEDRRREMYEAYQIGHPVFGGTP